MTDRRFDPERLEAIVFDIDGTLYRQDLLRRAMAARLVCAYATRPLTGLRTLRVLRAYRKAQEHLREAAPDKPTVDLAEAQIRLACEWTHADRGFVNECVARWMEQGPLDLLVSRIRPGLIEFLDTCTSRGLKLGVLSDYPADAKLNALGLTRRFDVVLAAQSPEIGVFKPHPRGLFVVMERLRVTPSACLYVGDRADVDGPVAAAAGVSCCILTDSLDPEGTPTSIRVTGFDQLQKLVFGQSSVVAQPILDVR